MPKIDLEQKQSRVVVRDKKPVKTISEETVEQRQSRVSFKNYLRQVREEELEDSYDLDDGGQSLTEEDEKFIIGDFKEWSGGVLPEESSDGELQAYAYEEAPKQLDAQEVLSFLRSYAGE